MWTCPDLFGCNLDNASVLLLYTMALIPIVNHPQNTIKRRMSPIDEYCWYFTWTWYRYVIHARTWRSSIILYDMVMKKWFMVLYSSICFIGIWFLIRRHALRKIDIFSLLVLSSFHIPFVSFIYFVFFILLVARPGFSLLVLSIVMTEQLVRRSSSIHPSHL